MTDLAQRLTAALADRYRIERELGQGGMATVYLAEDLKHRRQVAVKVLRPELAAALGPERFLREIETTANLRHPHLLPLYDSGEADGFLYYVMPFVEGESLRDRLSRERQLPLDDALQIAGEVADALSYAHSRGVIHRDIKPENILLESGHAAVADFGIAKAITAAGGERLTETGLAIGTAPYMSPEQAAGEKDLDGRSDLYALGCVLFEMLAGQPPFSGPTVESVVRQHLTATPPPVTQLRPAVPAEIAGALQRALAKTPADRFPSAAVFAGALRSTPPLGASPAGRHPPSRWRMLLALGLLVVIAPVGWWLLGTSHRLGRRVRDPELVALYRRALHSYDRRTAAGTAEAVNLFSAAVRRDSTYAAAWTGLAKTYVRAYVRPFPIPGIPRDSVLHLAVAAVDAALAADRRDPDAWLAHAMVSRAVDPTDLGPAFRSLRQALALDSTSAPAWDVLAMSLAETGDLGGALQAWRRSVRANPSYTQGIAFLGMGHYWHGQYDSATVWGDSAIALDPNYLLGRTVVGLAAIARGDFSRGAAAFDAAGRLSGEVELVNAWAGSALAEALAGRRAAARAILQRADSLAAAYSPVPLHAAVFVAQAYVALGETNRALAWLTRYEPRGDLHFQLHLRCDPPFAPILNDERFRSLLTLPPPPRGQGC